MRPEVVRELAAVWTKQFEENVGMAKKDAPVPR